MKQRLTTTDAAHHKTNYAFPPKKIDSIPHWTKIYYQLKQSKIQYLAVEYLLSDLKRSDIDF